MKRDCKLNEHKCKQWISHFLIDLWHLFIDYNRSSKKSFRAQNSHDTRSPECVSSPAFRDARGALTACHIEPEWFGSWSLSIGWDHLFSNSTTPFYFSIYYTKSRVIKLLVWGYKRIQIKKLSAKKFHNFLRSTTFVLTVFPSEIVYKIWISLCHVQDQGHTAKPRH